MTLTADDKLAIADLHARYYVSTDEADVDGFMACWAEDGDVLFDSAFGTFPSRDTIRAFEDEHVHRGMAVGKRHILTNLTIRPGDRPGTALTTSYLQVIDVVNAPRIIATAIYRDSVVEKTANGWRFRVRKMDVDPGFAKVMAGEGAHQAA
ncbi:MAG: nuclear transport factor 2 family protein [Rhodospirillaceae bacterium]|nr:nuclear transport factor 2 family protein [Rhodospirillaceae bacterium]